MVTGLEQEMPKIILDCPVVPGKKESGEKKCQKDTRIKVNKLEKPKLDEF